MAHGPLPLFAALPLLQLRHGGQPSIARRTFFCRRDGLGAVSPISLVVDGFRG